MNWRNHQSLKTWNWVNIIKNTLSLKLSLKFAFITQKIGENFNLDEEDANDNKDENNEDNPFDIDTMKGIFLFNLPFLLYKFYV